MPFYEYQCQSCGAQIEALQKISDPPLRKCPECGKSRLQKLVSAPVFRLKGGGWYETDFKTDKDNKRNLVETEKAETKVEPKTEAKPEPKADAKAEAKPAKPEPKNASRAASKSATKPAAKSAAKRKAKR
ncbi:MAG: zinc ribbon domain-containing protein [Pseudomonadota bacterium]